jgi:CMP-N-acetylneuraminic acid synthetase
MWTAIIPARSGSKGLPQKNIYLLGGKPLYLYSLESAQSAKATKICLSTNIESIVNSSLPPNCIIDRRSEALAGDDTTMAQVLVDLCTRKVVEGTLVLLQPTSPLRCYDDILKAIEIYNCGEYKLVMSVSKTPSDPLKYGFVCNSRFIPLSNVEYTFQNRQSLPILYRPNGAIYVFDSELIIKYNGFPRENIGVIISTEGSDIDIDCIDDIVSAENKLVLNRW